MDTSKVDVTGNFLLTGRCYHQSSKGRASVYVLTNYWYNMISFGV